MLLSFDTSGQCPVDEKNVKVRPWSIIKVLKALIESNSSIERGGCIALDFNNVAMPPDFAHSGIIS